MAAHVMSGGKYFCLSLKSSSCSQLVSKCEDVLSAHATLSTRSHARTHTHSLEKSDDIWAARHQFSKSAMEAIFWGDGRIQGDI